MSKIVHRNQPCEHCGSSDAKQIYEDGSAYCFSCKTAFRSGGEVAVKPQKTTGTFLTVPDIVKLRSAGMDDRKISRQVCEFYGVRMLFNEDGHVTAHCYPYAEETAFKVRKLPKDFSWVGKAMTLFGKDKFPEGGKRLVITEGEVDALSVAQANFERWGNFYPVVALPSASTAEKVLLENWEWVRAFEEVILMLDSDKAGKEATQIAARIIGFDKVRLAHLPEKDPNDVLRKHGAGRLLQSLFDARPFVPSGIVGKEEIWEALVKYNSTESTPYPPCLNGLNHKLKGMRGGEITLFVSGTGSGKSTTFREIMMWILETTDAKIGVVSLEESPAETARKLAGMKLKRNPAKSEIPLEELKEGFDAVFGDDRVLLLDHQGSINDGTIGDKLEYMCLMGCKFLFVDHITILASEGVDNLVGNEAQDKMMNDLLRLVKRHPDVWMGLVSHLRKTASGRKSFEEGELPTIDDIRGSGSVKQVSFDIVSFARNLTAEDDVVRNSMRMCVLKSRYTGLTGHVNGAFYNYDTGRLEALDRDFSGGEDFVSIS